MTGRRVLLAVATFSLTTQILSATIQNRDLSLLHARVATNLVRDGRLAVGRYRAYVLPGEALYLAAGFVAVPEPAWRYLHVPVALLFTCSVATVALATGGPSLALAAGLAAGLDPFFAIHGPIWDDIFLAAALEWFIFATLIIALRRASPCRRHAIEVLGLCVLGCAAALAALTRAQSQVVLLLLAFATISLKPLRPIRPAGWTILLAVAIAMTLWGVRNLHVLGTFHVGSTHDGKTLYESNCAYTREGIRSAGFVGGFLEKCSEVPLAHHMVSLGELEADRQFARYAWNYIASHPADVAKTAALKVFVSFSGFDFSVPALSVRNVGAFSSSLILLAAGISGLLLVFRAMPRTAHLDAFFLMFVLTTCTTLILLMIGPPGLRYRIGLAGFLYVGVGALAVHAMASVTVNSETGRLGCR